MGIFVYLRASRLPFLTGSLFPVVVATALAYLIDHTWNFLFFGLTALGVAALQVGANLINDYYDSFGSDPLNRNFTPFSGGSGTLPSGLLPPSVAVFADPALNRDLYLWLALLTAHWVPSGRWLTDNVHATRRALSAFPGFQTRYQRLCDLHLAQLLQPRRRTKTIIGTPLLDQFSGVFFIHFRALRLKNRTLVKIQAVPLQSLNNIFRHTDCCP